jgi:hypothetical protein
MTATKLEQLLIKEVSGVDDPANGLPGWLVMKARGDDREAEAVWCAAVWKAVGEVTHNYTLANAMAPDTTDSAEFLALCKGLDRMHDEDPERYRNIVVAALTDEERATVKAMMRHAERHPTTGQYAPREQPPRQSLWRHGGASLFR